MRGIIKRLLLLVCVMCLAFGGSLTAMAKENSQNEVAQYDLVEGGVQTYTLLDENNQEYYITIEHVNLNSRIAAGTYKITHEVPNAWKGSFYATISANKFTSVYSPEASALRGSVSDYYLVKDSSTQATLHVKWRSTIITYDTGFEAWIENGSLYTKKR